MLLEEFENVQAVIEPKNDLITTSAMEICDILIYSFDGAIVETIKNNQHSHIGGYCSSLNGKHYWYIYEIEGFKVAVMLATIGAPMAVGQLEELKAIGFRQFIVLGSCGVLDKSIQADKIILPETALRDEGTSYHYASASDEISYDEMLLQTMELALSKAGINCVRAKAWTTDAFYRETPDKVKRRLAAGAEVVDMEASAIMAWSQYRQAEVYQFFYTADYVDHDNIVWDKHQDERSNDTMIFFDIALVIARELLQST